MTQSSLGRGDWLEMENAREEMNQQTSDSVSRQMHSEVGSPVQVGGVPRLGDAEGVCDFCTPSRHLPQAVIWE